MGGTYRLSISASKRISDSTALTFSSEEGCLAPMPRKDIVFLVWSRT